MFTTDVSSYQTWWAPVVQQKRFLYICLFYEYWLTPLFLWTPVACAILRCQRHAFPVSRYGVCRGVRLPPARYHITRGVPTF